MRKFFAPAAVIALAGAASAQVIDGTRVGDSYGAARAVQSVETQFGDNASEWNAAYATVAGGRLNLMLTGNLEANFNKLEIFIDSTAGGFGTFPSLPGNDGTGGTMGGRFQFDSNFTPEYHLIVRRGFAPGGKFDVDFAILGTNTFSSYQDLFGGNVEGAATTGTGANASPINVGYNNSNVAGILGGTNAADQSAALAVDTGLELSIDLADLGSPAGAFGVMVFQNNQGHNYASNQFLGGLAAPQGNLGGDGFGGFTGTLDLNMNNYAGNQWFSVPEPTTLSLLALGGLAMLRRRN